MSSTRNAALAALKEQLSANEADKFISGLAARRAMAAYAAEEGWSEGQLRKGGPGFGAIGFLMQEAGYSPSFASKMRGFAHPLMRVKFADAEKAAVALQKQHGGAVLSHLDKLSMLIRKKKCTVADAKKAIDQVIAERNSADKLRERLVSIRKWFDVSPTLCARVPRPELDGVIAAIDAALAKYKKPSK